MKKQVLPKGKSCPKCGNIVDYYIDRELLVMEERCLDIKCT